MNKNISQEQINNLLGPFLPTLLLDGSVVLSETRGGRIRSSLPISFHHGSTWLYIT